MLLFFLYANMLDFSNGNDSPEVKTLHITDVQSELPQLLTHLMLGGSSYPGQEELDHLLAPCAIIEVKVKHHSIDGAANNSK